jgi:hypothetical protein
MRIVKKIKYFSSLTIFLVVVNSLKYLSFNHAIFINYDLREREREETW